MIDPKTKLVGATCKVVQHKFVFFEPRSESELIARKTFHTCQNKKTPQKEDGVFVASESAAAKMSWSEQKVGSHEGELHGRRSNYVSAPFHRLLTGLHTVSDTLSVLIT